MAGHVKGYDRPVVGDIHFELLGKGHSWKRNRGDEIHYMMSLASDLSLEPGIVANSCPNIYRSIIVRHFYYVKLAWERDL